MSLLDTYSNPGGNTPQATQGTSLLDTLRNMNPLSGYVGATAQGIQAQASAPSDAQAQKATLSTQAGIPAAIDAYGKQTQLLEMFMHDMELNNKYANPSSTPPADAAGLTKDLGAYGAPKVPILTTSTNQNFPGFSTPYGASGAEALGASQYITAANMLNDFITKQTGNVNTAMQDYGTYQQSKVSALSALADLYSNLFNVQQGAEQQAKTNATDPLAIEAQLSADIDRAQNNRTSLDAIVKRYENMGVDPSHVLQRWIMAKGSPAPQDLQKIVDSYSISEPGILNRLTKATTAAQTAQKKQEKVTPVLDKNKKVIEYKTSSGMVAPADSNGNILLINPQTGQPQAVHPKEAQDALDNGWSIPQQASNNPLDIIKNYLSIANL